MANKAANRMQMRKECIERIQLSLGKKITESEAADILSGLRAGMDQARAQDPLKWASMSKQERADAAAKFYQEQLKADAQKIRQRARLTVIAQDRINRRAEFHRARGYKGLAVTQAILEDVNRSVIGEQNRYVTQFCEVLDGKVPGFLGLFEDKRFAKAFLDEIYGKDSGSKLAKDAAKAFTETSEAQRLRFNANGGNLGKLEHYFPQNHSVSRMSHAAEVLAGQGKLRQTYNTLVNTFGKRENKYEENKAAWVDFVSPLIDRSRYLDLNGDVMGDVDFRDMLARAYDTIITNGDQDFVASTVAGQSARGNNSSRVNRGNNHRALHFKDSDAFFQYRQAFGQGSVLDTAIASIRRTAKDIALLEDLGPNPNAMVRGMVRVGEAEINQGRTVQGYIKKHAGVQFVSASWSVLNGDADRVLPNREIFSDFMQGARNMEVVGKLQSTLISSISDLPTYFISSGLYKIPALKSVTNLLHGLGKENKALMLRAGVLADTLSQGLTRWGENNVGQGWTGALANATMKVSLLDGWTQCVRRASMQNMMGMLADVLRNSTSANLWSDIHPVLKMALERAGVDQKVWDIWKRAKLTDINGAKFLTTQDILEIPLPKDKFDLTGTTQRDLDDAARKLIVLLTDESGIASLNPDLFTRAAASWGFEKGSYRGEAIRSLMLFKSFPLGFMRRHLERMEDLGRVGESRFKYAAAIFATTTLAGAISVQIKELIAGRDPQDMGLNLDFWLQAMSVGGGAGFLADIIVAGLDGQNSYGAPNMIRSLGPAFGTVMDTFDLGKTAYNEVMKSQIKGLYDRETKSGAKALRLIRGHAPFVNLWYVKKVVDNAVYNDLMEMASPGYCARVEKHALKNKGTGYWWGMNGLKPRRAPNWDVQNPTK